MNFAAGNWTCAYPCCLAGTTPAARPRTNTWTHTTWHRFCAVPSRASANPGDNQEVPAQILVCRQKPSAAVVCLVHPICARSRTLVGPPSVPTGCRSGDHLRGLCENPTMVHLDCAAQLERGGARRPGR